jgi:hypothetical protein
MQQRPAVKQANDQDGEEGTGQENERGYHALYNGKDMAFDPMKDLNLPANYNEVMARFRKLQGDRSPDLN